MIEVSSNLLCGFAELCVSARNTFANPGFAQRRKVPRSRKGVLSCTRSSGPNQLTYLCRILYN